MRHSKRGCIDRGSRLHLRAFEERAVTLSQADYSRTPVPRYSKIGFGPSRGNLGKGMQKPGIYAAGKEKKRDL